LTILINNSNFADKRSGDSVFFSRTRLAGGKLALVGLGLRGRVLGLAGGALGEVGLVPLPLRVGQVVPLVVVQRQAQLALIATNKQN
jgi:hypothetical protein